MDVFPRKVSKRHRSKRSNGNFDITSEYRDKIKPSEQKTIQLPKINPCDSKLDIDDDVYNRRRMPIIQRPVLKPIPRSILEKYANKQLPAMSHPTSERLYQDSIGKYHMYDEFQVEKRRPRRKVPSINFSDIEEQIRSVDIEESPKHETRKNEVQMCKLERSMEYNKYRKPRSHRDEHYVHQHRKHRPRSNSRKSRKKKSKKKSRSPTRYISWISLHAYFR